jgi:hypothetical protein
VGRFVRIAPYLRTVLAAHVSLKLLDRCRLRPADHIERNGLVRVTAETSHFQIKVTSVQRVTQCRRWLRRSPEAEHAFVPCFTCQPIGFLAGLLGALCRRANGCTVDRPGEPGAHPAWIAREGSNRRPLGFARHTGWPTARRGYG